MIFWKETSSNVFSVSLSSTSHEVHLVCLKMFNTLKTNSKQDKEVKFHIHTFTNGLPGGSYSLSTGLCKPGTEGSSESVFFHTNLLSAQHELRFPARQELPGERAVFQSALSKTLN